VGTAGKQVGQEAVQLHGGASKSFLGLLNGLARRTYYGDENITDGFLKEELYPEMPEGDFEALLSKCNGLIKVDILTVTRVGWGASQKFYDYDKI